MSNSNTEARRSRYRQLRENTKSLIGLLSFAYVHDKAKLRQARKSYADACRVYRGEIRKLFPI